MGIDAQSDPILGGKRKDFYKNSRFSLSSASQAVNLLRRLSYSFPLQMDAETNNSKGNERKFTRILASISPGQK